MMNHEGMDVNKIREVYALRGLLYEAGIQGQIVEIPNRYWPETQSYDSVRTPWLKVYTPRGVIVIGWRKRVIAIDWSDSAINKHGSEVVESESTTYGERFCHAWGYDQALACLKRLWLSEDYLKALKWGRDVVQQAVGDNPTILALGVLGKFDDEIESAQRDAEE